MGRVILFLLVVITIIVLWKAFVSNPQGRTLNGRRNSPRPEIPKGPDDDPDFLWKLDKARFEERKRRQRQAEYEEKKQRGAQDKKQRKNKGPGGEH